MTRITVVTTPADSYNLVTLAQAKQSLLIATETTTYDALLRQIIARASDTFARACDRVFALEEVADTFRINNYTEALCLSRYPVVEITDVVVNAVAADEDAFFVDAAKGLLYLESSYGFCPTRWRPGKIVVSYTGGYVLPGGEEPTGSRLLPDDVTAAVLDMIGIDYHDTINASASDLRSEDIPGVISQTFATTTSTTGTQAFPAHISDAIARYRVPVIA